MKKNISSWTIFSRGLFILFIVFLINYFSVSSGYYENEIKKKTAFTQEQIKQFEEDVQNKEYIDTKDYNKEEVVDNSSFIGDIGYKVSEGINDFVTDKAINVFKFLGRLFT